MRYVGNRWKNGIVWCADGPSYCFTQAALALAVCAAFSSHSTDARRRECYFENCILKSCQRAGWETGKQESVCGCVVLGVFVFRDFLRTFDPSQWSREELGCFWGNYWLRCLYKFGWIRVRFRLSTDRHAKGS